MTQHASAAPSQGRLQRDPGLTGGRINSFRQIFLRHGLPGAVLALLLLAHPDIRQNASFAITLPLQAHYLAWAVAILIALSTYAAVIYRQWAPHQTAWILYLGALSLWEEWAFRLAIPYSIASTGLPLWAAVVSTNILFSGMHYFTLRWKWQWCALTFLGSMALSRQMNLHQDLFLITAFHWVATFINTPRSPGK